MTYPKWIGLSEIAGKGGHAATLCLARRVKEPERSSLIPGPAGFEYLGQGHVYEREKQCELHNHLHLDEGHYAGEMVKSFVRFAVNGPLRTRALARFPTDCPIRPRGWWAV
jgi:hypothetical protein